MLFSGPDIPQILLLPLGDCTPSNTWFLGPIRVYPVPIGISIGSAIFAGLTNVTNIQTDIQTDHATRL